MANSNESKFIVPLYLFKGSEIGEKNDALAELKGKARKKFSDVDFNTFYASEDSINEVMMQLSNGSLFSQARFYVVKAAESIKKKDDIALIEGWKNSAQDRKDDSSILVLISDENSVEKKLESIVPKENVKTFWEMFENKKLPWVKDYFRKNGFKITEDAAQSILNLVENNTEELKSECSRFFVCFDENHVINAEDVDKILAHNKEETPFTLFNAMCDAKKDSSSRLENSLEIMQKILSSKKDAHISLVSGLIYSFRQLKDWCILNQNGRVSETELRSNGFYIKSAWAQYDNACRIWNPQQIQKCIAVLTKCDIELRSSAKELKDSVLQLALYQIIMKKGNPLSIYES